MHWFFNSMGLEKQGHFYYSLIRNSVQIQQVWNPTKREDFNLSLTTLVTMPTMQVALRGYYFRTLHQVQYILFRSVLSDSLGACGQDHSPYLFLLRFLSVLIRNGQSHKQRGSQATYLFIHPWFFYQRMQHIQHTVDIPYLQNMKQLQQKILNTNNININN